jgi:putative hydrolase of HD superfamily
MKLENALKFLEEIDQLKDTYRQCLVMSGSREENTAEHSFSLAMAVLSLSSFSNEKIDVSKTVKMALCHDIVEAYAGDKFHYHKDEDENLEEIEAESLEKIISVLGESSELASEIRVLWHEFEEGATAESRFLRGIDRFLPMYHNYKTKGHSWIKHKVTKEMALDKNSHIQKSSEVLWDFTKEMLETSKEQGWIK